jgi:succinoglycan biosynthesis transport protein ExoP
MSILQFFRILWARRMITTVTFAAALVGGLMIIKFIPPSYEATSRVLLEIMKPDPVSGESVSSSFARAYTRTQVELIRDYRVAGRVVDHLGWTDSAVLAEEYRRSGSEMDYRRWLAQRIINNTNAELLDGSNILEISYSSSRPEISSRVADALREAYEEQTMLFKQQAAQRNGQWFERQTSELKKKLSEAEARKAQFERENGIILNDDSTDAESARLAALAQAAATPTIATSGVAMPTTSPSQALLAQIDASIASASQQLGPNHPDLQNMQRQRAVVAQAAARELADARAAAAASRPVSSGPSASAMFSAQRQRVLSQRGQLAEARQLLNDVMVLRAQLQKTSDRAAQLDQEAQSTETGLTRLGSAAAPDTPKFPRPLPVLAGSIALGLGLGILLSLMTELLNRRIRGIEDLAIEGVPVIGVVSGEPTQRRLTYAKRLLPRPS